MINITAIVCLAPVVER